LYYISPDGVLKELCKDSGAESRAWTNGLLNDSKFPAVPNTPITAVLSAKAKSIKVYYYAPAKGGENAPWVAWHESGSKGWNTLPIIGLS
jgi:hypothetical protein